MKLASRRARICFLMQEGKMAGIEFNAVTLVQVMDPRTCEVVFAIPYEDSLTQTCLEKGLSFTVVPRPRLCSTSLRLGSHHCFNPLATLYNLACFYFHARKLAAFFRRERFDLVVTKGLMANFYGAMAAKKAKVPCLWDLQDVVNVRRFFGLFRFALGLWARMYKVTVVAGSQALARQLPHGVQAQGKVHVVYNGVDVRTYHAGVDGRELRRQWGVGDDEILIGHCARFAYWKGQIDFVRAAALASGHYPHLKFVLVGAPVFEEAYFENKIKSEIAKLGLQDRVVLAGFRKDLPQVLGAMDIYVHSSIKAEGCPLTVILAMACAKPIIATDVPGTNELVRDYATGLLIPPGAPDRLAQAMERLVVDRRLREELGKCARRVAQDQFSVRAYAANTQRVLDQLLSTGTPKKRKKILFVHGRMKGFVRKDRDILNKHFDVIDIDTYRLRWGLLSLLIREIRRTECVFFWFAGRHALLPMLLARWMHKKTVVVAGGWDVVNLPEIHYGLMRPHWRATLARWILHQADRVVCVSKSNRQEAMVNAKIPQEKIVSIYHGFEATADGTYKKSNNTVVTVGDVTWSNLKRKGMETFVKTAALIPEARFCLVGRWVDDSILHLKKIATSNVEFLGFQDSGRLHALLGQAKVYVQVSYHEAFACSLAEAMLCGCIPVVTDRFALPEVVGDTGLYVPYEDIEETARAIRKALASDESLCEKARSRVMKCFSLEQREESLVKVVTEILHGNSRERKAA